MTPLTTFAQEVAAGAYKPEELRERALAAIEMTVHQTSPLGDDEIELELKRREIADLPLARMEFTAGVRFAELCHKAALEVADAVQGWISVEDRLPDNGSEVLCCGQGFGEPFVMSCWYDHEKEGWWSSGTHWTDAFDGQQYPTHWRDLPPPPVLPDRSET